jgi:hypothetical protein
MGPEAELNLDGVDHNSIRVFADLLVSYITCSNRDHVPSSKVPIHYSPKSL